MVIAIIAIKDSTNITQDQTNIATDSWWECQQSDPQEF